MSTQGVPSTAWNPWKWAANGIALLLVIGLVTASLITHRAQSSNPQPDTAPVAAEPLDTGAQLAAPPPAAPAVPPAPQSVAPPGPVIPKGPFVPPGASAPRPLRAPRAAVRAGDAPVAAPRPSAADIEACNHYASSGSNPAADALTGAVVGGLTGAGLGAAGGAIADGGHGAGKGAAIGGLVGATAGTLFGLNRANQRDARVAAAYRQCMRQRG